MISFFVCLAILIIGFMLYSKVAEKVFGPDDRKPPALSMTDGSDYVPMGTPRIFLIQLLNIAGLGPIFGALAGACWGPSVFLWITFGTLLGGGVHDYMVGMMSMRHKGASVSELTGVSYTSQGVVTDGNITTGRGLGFALDMGLELIRLLQGPQQAQKIAAAIQYNWK